MTKEDIINKVLKLLQLGDANKNENIHQREAAMNKAAKLMAEHAVSFADLREGRVKESPFTHVVIDGSSINPKVWELILCTSIAKVFDCSSVNSLKPSFQMHVLGEKSDVELAVFFYTYLSRSVRNMVRVHTTKEKLLKEGYLGNESVFRDSYANGITEKIRSRLEDLYSKREAFIPSTGKELMVVKMNEVSSYVKSVFPNLTKVTKTMVRDGHAYMKGLNDGEKVNISRPIAGNGATQEGAIE
jgi:hypothetical protein